jgi:hypothetical protein
MLHFLDDTLFRKKKVEGMRTEEESVKADDEQGSENSTTAQHIQESQIQDISLL